VKCTGKIPRVSDHCCQAFVEGKSKLPGCGRGAVVVVVGDAPLAAGGTIGALRHVAGGVTGVASTGVVADFGMENRSGPWLNTGNGGKA
jgi:hypothetical protein